MHECRVKGLLSAQNGMNLYRGCTHGCIYCDARSHCYHMDHAFEDVEVKINAPELLETALRRKREKCMIGTGAMSDPYIPLERKLGLTRRCLTLIAEYGFGLAIQTKSTDVLRDLDLLEEIERKAKCVVQMTLTTLDDALCKIVEPNVSPTGERLQALETLRAHGIPTVVWLTPILPYLNDTVENISGLVTRAAQAGVKGIISFGLGLTLRDGNREYFYQKLDAHFPGLKRVYVERYGRAYELPSPHADVLLAQFHAQCEALGLMHDDAEIFRYLQTFPSAGNGEQLRMF